MASNLPPPTDYQLVFDACQAGYRYWGVPLAGVASGLVNYAMDKLVARRGFTWLKPKWQFIGSRGIYALLAIWTAIVFAGTFSGYRGLCDAVKDQRCDKIEGTVRNFVPMPYEGHAVEHFDVASSHFEYSDYIAQAGFNKTQSHGGPIHEGLWVRICEADGRIARLEIAR